MKGLIIDGFVDGSKMMVCPHQFEDCEKRWRFFEKRKLIKNGRERSI